MLFVAQEGLQEDKDKKTLIKAGIAGGVAGAGIGVAGKLARRVKAIAPGGKNNALKISVIRGQKMVEKDPANARHALARIVKQQRRIKFGGKWGRIGLAAGVATGVGLGAAKVAARRKARQEAAK